MTTGNTPAVLFNITLPVTVPDGWSITATATGPSGTSEFSQCVLLSGGSGTGCSFSLPPRLPFSSNNGYRAFLEDGRSLPLGIGPSFSASFSFFTGSQCEWTAVSDSTWITITSDRSGKGSGTISFNVAPNSNFFKRSGKITVGDIAFNVFQFGSGCQVFTLPTSISIPSSGGPGLIDVIGKPGCTASFCDKNLVTAHSSDTWLKLIPAFPLPGQNRSCFPPTQIGYFVEPNVGPTRLATIVVSYGTGTFATSVSITQSGGPDFSLSFDQSTIESTPGSSVEVVLKINRTGGLSEPVFVKPPFNEDKIKVKPSLNQIVSGAEKKFTLKLKNKAKPGVYQLVFTGQWTDKKRSAILTLIIR